MNQIKIPAGGYPECQEDEQNEKVNQDTASSNKPRDKWEEGLNKERNSNERIQRERRIKVLCTYEDFPSNAGEKDDHAQATPYSAPNEDGGYG